MAVSPKEGKSMAHKSIQKIQVIHKLIYNIVIFFINKLNIIELLSNE